MTLLTRVLILIGVATAALAQTVPVYEPIWATGQSIFRLHAGQPETVYRHKSVVSAVGAGAGGRIVFLADKVIWLLDRGGTKPVKVGRAPRPLCAGPPLEIESLFFEDRSVSVTVGYCNPEASGPNGTWSVKLPKAIETIAPVTPAELALDPARVLGAPGVGVVTASSVELKCSAALPRIVVDRGGVSVTLIDLSKDVTCDDDGNEVRDTWSEFQGATWLVGGHLLVAVLNQRGSGWTESSVLPAGKTSVVTCGDVALAPDSNGAICGGTYLGPKGEVQPLGPNAVWSER